jgi:Fe-S-cluster-containing dehydrogenase component
VSKGLIKLDEGRCIGCKACEIQCQVKNRTPSGVRPGLLVSIGPSRMGEKVRTAAAFRPCFHCETPWCVAACPVGAMVKDKADGIVRVIRDLCVGCRACIDACPWKVPQWDETRGKVVKCDSCQDRVAGGLQPACVAACTTHALSFSRANEGLRKVRHLYAKSLLVDKKAG